MMYPKTVISLMNSNWNFIVSKVKKEREREIVRNWGWVTNESKLIYISCLVLKMSYSLGLFYYS